MNDRSHRDAAASAAGAPPAERTFSTPESLMPPTPRPREGFALAVAMIAIVVIGALIAGAFFASTQEYRMGRNSLVDHRAFAAAEAGVTQPVQGWIKALNLSVANGQTLAPDTLKLPGGAYAVRRVTRLNDHTFWVMSDGYAGGSSGPLAAHHRVNAIYRLAYPRFNVLGALTVRGQVEVQGSSRVDGTDQVPLAWSTAGICPLPGPALAGVAAPDTTLVCNGTCPENKSETPRIFGSPAQSEDPAAADTNTYYKYGDESWKTLTMNADITLSGGVYKTLPSLTADGRCNIKDPVNWGDPMRTTTCADWFPIIHIKGDLKIQSNSRGQGVLLVEGDMEMQGNFEFNGIVIVRDDIRSTGTGNKITGGAFAGNTYTADNTSVSGNSEIQYSTCAIDRAAKGSSTVVRAKQRGWYEAIE